jgi:hypothetical protein
MLRNLIILHVIDYMKKEFSNLNCAKASEKDGLIY